MSRSRRSVWLGNRNADVLEISSHFCRKWRARGFMLTAHLDWCETDRFTVSIVDWLTLHRQKPIMLFICFLKTKLCNFTFGFCTFWAACGFKKVFETINEVSRNKYPTLALYCIAPLILPKVWPTWSCCCCVC